MFMSLIYYFVDFSFEDNFNPPEYYTYVLSFPIDMVLVLFSQPLQLAVLGSLGADDQTFASFPVVQSDNQNAFKSRWSVGVNMRNEMILWLNDLMYFHEYLLTINSNLCAQDLFTTI